MPSHLTTTNSIPVTTCWHNQSSAFVCNAGTRGRRLFAPRASLSPLLFQNEKISLNTLNSRPVLFFYGANHLRHYAQFYNRRNTSLLRQRRFSSSLLPEKAVMAIAGVRKTPLVRKKSLTRGVDHTHYVYNITGRRSFRIRTRAIITVPLLPVLVITSEYFKKKSWEFKSEKRAKYNLS